MVATYGFAAAESATVSRTLGAVANVTGKVTVTVAGVPAAVGPVKVAEPVTAPALSAVLARLAK
jgi:hypothetical protein